MIELYHKHIWNDPKTVNVVVTACFSPITKIMVAAIVFFLGKGEDEDRGKDSSDSDDDEVWNGGLLLQCMRCCGVLLVWCLLIPTPARG